MFTDTYIGGTWRPGAGGVLPVHDPASGEVLAEVALAGVEDCLAACDAAAGAGPQWAGTPPRDRAEVLRRAHTLMTGERDAFAELIVRENGKVLTDARAEVGYAAEFFRWYSEEAVRIGGDCRLAPSGDKRILVLKQPVGVALLVTPWNFPAAMATRKIAPALAAGCTVVLKPAPETPLTALAVADLLERAGVPPGVVNVVLPEPPDAAVRAMLEHPAVRALSFTGSTAVGALLLAAAAPGILATSMELGGNAPFLVFDDADLGAAVDSAMVAKMRNGGAACTAANRFLVHEAVAAGFTERFVARMAALRGGAPLDPATEVGALVTGTERDRVHELVVSTADRGATVLTGGAPVAGPGYGYPPTVLGGVPPDAPILGTEIFGPVAPIVTFGSDAEAVDLANATTHGLVGYVHTRDLARGLRAAEAIETGMVGLNRGVVSDPAAPFGGMKRSGLGREGGPDGIEEYLETKYVAVSWAG